MTVVLQVPQAPRFVVVWERGPGRLAGFWESSQLRLA